MTVSTSRTSWSARLLIGLVLIIAGAAAATWALARYEPAAEFLGVTQPAPPEPSPQAAISASPAAPDATAAPMLANQSLAMLEARLARVENATQQAQGSAGRADALVVAFAARRAIDRGVALGYLENLLVERFGARQQRAVGTIIAASHKPVRLNDLLAEYETLGPELRRGGPQDSWWTNFKRELGSLIEVHRAHEPSVNADARYNRAVQRLAAGDVDQALAETMRLPGAVRAQGWIDKARRYVAAHRALDEIESAALLTGNASPR
ncbi:hypothetical protein H9L13_01370 [Sphingomonas lutea]|uniref:Uncharacterized protein n=1 Tax=Sphingomonas lutea TaxID=1045317 RepID=A0A7G9SIF9_9SPHN|nr:hypothetical protein [Sphingomonas lutea]QNN67634.1 hypothetical protein H9L13_01370 [Sphingomonas lutea]